MIHLPGMYVRMTGKGGSERVDEEEGHSKAEEMAKCATVDLCTEYGQEEQAGGTLACRGNGDPGNR